MLTQTTATTVSQTQTSEVEPAERGGSLKPVLDIIPADAYANPTWKGLAYLARDLVIYALVAFALIEIGNPFAVLGLEFLAALAVGSLFIVGHDVAHGALLTNKRLSAIVGRLAMLPGWHVYDGWVLGHNRIHHAFTVREGYDFVWHPYTAEQYRAMPAWQRARHRVEWSWMGAGFYYMREVWWHKMIVGKPPARWVKSIRRDRWIVLAAVVIAAVALSWIGWDRTGSVTATAWLVTRVLVFPFLGFSYLVGSLVHVHHVNPDIRWWRRREWTKFKGQMDGTTILRARYGLNFFFHWIMVHIPHHVDMRIPMYNLERAADAIKAAYPDVVHEEPLRFGDFVRNTRRCKLYDFDRGEWLSYEDALTGS